VNLAVVLPELDHGRACPAVAPSTALFFFLFFPVRAAGCGHHPAAGLKSAPCLRACGRTKAAGRPVPCLGHSADRQVAKTSADRDHESLPEGYVNDSPVSARRRPGNLAFLPDPVSRTRCLGGVQSSSALVQTRCFSAVQTDFPRAANRDPRGQPFNTIIPANERRSAPTALLGRKSASGSTPSSAGRSGGTAGASMSRLALQRSKRRAELVG